MKVTCTLGGYLRFAQRTDSGRRFHHPTYGPRYPDTLLSLLDPSELSEEITVTRDGQYYCLAPVNPDSPAPTLRISVATQVKTGRTQEAAYR